MKTDFDQTINGQSFTIGSIHAGIHAGKWVWSTSIDESEPFETACEAQADAILYVREQDAADRERAEEEARFAKHGHCRMSDVEFDFKTSRL